MDELVQFTPIFDKKPENILQYYKDNNIEIPDIPLFKKYLESAQESADTAYEMQVTDSLNKPFYPTLKVTSEQTPKNEVNTNNNTIVKEILNKNISKEQKEYLIGLAKRESNFQPHVTNQFGYYGLYQFGKSALQDTGYTKKDFQTTDNQHDATLKLAQLNEKRLLPIINNYVGKEINGIKISKNGILAAAHLLGAATVKDWFLGTKNTDLAKGGFKDANGTKIEEYLQLYDY